MTHWDVIVRERDELRAEVARLNADKIKLAEENLQLRQIVDGYARAESKP